MTAPDFVVAVGVAMSSWVLLHSIKYAGRRRK